LRVAIHQPNYLPWLGYFYKITRADTFIFLDDAQYSKNSFINRVRVLGPNGAKWLTIPVSVHLGDSINEVWPAQEDWPCRHLDTLFNFYRSSGSFRQVWPQIENLYQGVSNSDLVSINSHLIKGITDLLGLSCRFLLASRFSVNGVPSDDRLVALVSAVDPSATYLSGRGAASYQNPDKFLTAGSGFEYIDFQHPHYDQQGDCFVSGLSVLDAVFRLGWRRTADLIQASNRA